MRSSRLKTALDSAELVLPEKGSLLVLHAQPGPDLACLPADRLVVQSSFRPDYAALQAQGLQVVEEASQSAGFCLVRITRAKEETLGLIAEAFVRTAPGGIVAVDGVKTDGIESALKRCRKAATVQGVVSKAHGKLFWMQRPEVVPAAVEAWLAHTIASENNAGFRTLPGLFSAQGADAGSALLADHFDLRLSGRVAELGAGWGWLAAQALARGNIDRIDLFEADKRALDLACSNLDDPRVVAHWSDVTQLAADPVFDAVITNPPFHASRVADPSLGQRFIASAAGLLKPAGHLWLVANRQLPYEAALEAQFAEVVILQSTPLFKVILASRPKSGKQRLHRIKSNRPAQSHAGPALGK